MGGGLLCESLVESIPDASVCGSLLVFRLCRFASVRALVVALAICSAAQGQNQTASDPAPGTFMLVGLCRCVVSL